MRKALFYLLIMFLGSCSNENEIEYYKRTFENDFQFDVPSYMKKIPGEDMVYESASMFLGDEVKQVYVFVMKDLALDLRMSRIDPSLEGFTDLAVELTESMLVNPVSKFVKSGNVNGLDYKSYSVKGLLVPENLLVYYRVTIFKSYATLYNLTTWCNLSDRFKYKEVTERMNSSFALIIDENNNKMVKNE